MPESATPALPAPNATAAVRLWDADFNHIATIGQGWRIDEPDTLVLPTSHEAAQWLREAFTDRSHRDANLTVDLNGVRLTYHLREVELVASHFGHIIRARFALT